MSKEKKYYVVWVGAKPGIYDSWEKCQQQITGFPKARYKSFKTKQKAEEAFGSKASEHIKPTHTEYGKGTTSKSPSKRQPASEGIIWESISVDAACSGNPGVMEYQGVDTKTKHQYFHQKFELGTNNIGEFLAIVHALAQFKKEGKNTPIYSDSVNAMIWVKNKKCKTTLVHNARTAKVHELIERAETWLKTNTYENRILKWETEKWGEIPADFGRK